MITAIHKSMAAKRDAIKNDDQGFTLIELLVVVLIIGILSAIAIPVFLGQQNQAKDTAAKSDLTNAKISLIAYAADNEGDITAATPTLLAPYGYVGTEGVDLALTGLTADGEFCATATSATTTVFSVTQSTGVAEGACGA